MGTGTVSIVVRYSYTYHVIWKDYKLLLQYKNRKSQGCIYKIKVHLAPTFPSFFKLQSKLGFRIRIPCTSFFLHWDLDPEPGFTNTKQLNISYPVHVTIFFLHLFCFTNQQKLLSFQESGTVSYKNKF
jgi:hypothetical protein